LDKAKLQAYLRKSGMRSQSRLDAPLSTENEPKLDEAQDRSVKLSADFFIQLADETWRLGRRASRLSRSAGVDAARGVMDSAERLQRVLADIGIGFEDHTGEPYRENEGLDVAQVEGEISESSALWIAQTIKPTVLVRGLVVRPGQVVISAQQPLPDGERTS
jgi:hypothetical protein